jgi:hypothetical protein
MLERAFKNPHAKALFDKGGEIIELVHEITDLIPEDDEMLKQVASFMKEDAYMLQVKVSGAEGGKLYDIRMECAAIIRKAGRDLYVQKHNLEMFDFEYVSYMDLLRDKLDEYKAIFIEWVGTFDPKVAIKDDWGLFNPPGVDLDDDYIPDDLMDDDDDDEL